MILQEVLTSQHAAKRKSTLLVWPLVTESESPERKKNSMLESNSWVLHAHRILSFRELQGFIHQKGYSEIPRKGATERPSYATEDFMLCFARCKRMEDAPSNCKSP